MMIEQLRTWLNTQGSPLEMRTAAAFRADGFEVTQSTHFTDSETQKSRELDVFARDIDPSHQGILDINFVIECKASAKPWVLLCSPDTMVGYNRFFSFAVSSESARHLLDKHFSELMEKLPWFSKQGLVGYSVRQAYSDNDVAFAATLAIAKAAVSVRRAVEERYKKFIFTFPVIVIDAPLFLCSLETDGNLKLEEVDEGEVLFLPAVPETLQTCIRIVTAKRLPLFVAEAKRMAEQLRAEFAVEVEAVRVSWKSEK
jgi:hypothetical protein